jgi:hypothetical protein
MAACLDTSPTAGQRGGGCSAYPRMATLASVPIDLGVQLALRPGDVLALGRAELTITHVAFAIASHEPPGKSKRSRQ